MLHHEDKGLNNNNNYNLYILIILSVFGSFNVAIVLVLLLLVPILVVLFEATTIDGLKANVKQKIILNTKLVNLLIP
jgi:hypothetical protein